MADYRRLHHVPAIETMILLYIDPGAGSMVIQAILAGLLAVPFLLRTQLGRAVDRMRRAVRRDSGNPAADE